MGYDVGGLLKLERALAAVPRYALATTPTPIQELKRLGRHLGGPRIFVKRDDLTGLAFGGNKVRQMEFFVGEALVAGADVLIAGGSYAQSNHARVAAAAANAAGLRSVILLRPGSGELERDDTGNGLLTRLLAADLRKVPELALVDRNDRLGELEARRSAFEACADEYRARGHNPYVLLGSSSPIGVYGYLAATLELAQQVSDLDIEFSKVFVTSLGATQAGLALGASVTDGGYDVIGIAYQPNAGCADTWVGSLAAGAAGSLGLPSWPGGGTPVNDPRFGGPAYGVPSPEGLEALSLAMRLEGLALDPIYTSKGFAALLAWIEEGRIARDESVLFVHTGGLPSLFAYGDTVSTPPIATAKETGNHE